MTDEIALNKAIARQAQAEALQRNELLNESFDGLIAAYTKVWRNSTDMDERERCWHRVQALDEVRQRLFMIISSGKIAQAELNEIVAKAAREKSNG